MNFQYRPQVLNQLLSHGICPTAQTEPEFVNDFVNDLYRYELRRLRDRQMRGEIHKNVYANYVVELRKKYILMSVPIRFWTLSDDESDNF